jgi:molybdate transport system ATP-binding protein
MTLSVALTHAFAGFTLDLTFSAPTGVTALFGRSGAGKTTIAQAVAGLLRPDRGRVVVQDRVLLDTDRGVFVPPHRRRIGYVFQEGRLFPHLTVRQNLHYGRWFAKSAQGPDETGQVTDLLGLGNLLGRYPAALSGGEKQRVALARAILSRPQMLVMDEPLAALDDARKAEILPYLERLRDEVRLPVLYVSHSVAEVARLATTVVLIERGRMHLCGPATEVLSDPNAAITLGPRDTGAIVAARMAGTDADGLSRLTLSGGEVWLPGIESPVGAPLRLRIMAQDVMLALDRPVAISALNILPCTVLDISVLGTGALVRVTCGTDTILARITARSAKALCLTQGQPVFAILKAVAVADPTFGLH